MSRARLRTFLLSAGWVLAALSASRAQETGVLTTLHAFNGSDGAGSNAALVQGSDGSFYGTTLAGGANNNGTVFQVTPAGGFISLYSFSALDGNAANRDGAAPAGALVQGADGSFYGTASGGGSNGNGTIFQITPAGVFSAVYAFSALDPTYHTNDDGTGPFAGLILGTDGNFYGTAYDGGSRVFGTVFQLTPAGAFTTLYDFDAGADGGQPEAALLQATDGNFYGTTASGGVDNYGTVFQITSAGVLTTLHSFSTPHVMVNGNLDNSDGANPNTGLVEGPDGNFYGTAYRGGADGHGTVYRITPAGAFTTLHSFSDSEAVFINAGLVLGRDGNFYGVTPSGGDHGLGTVYRITPAGLTTTIYSFADQGDGSAPEKELILASDGNFYGTTTYSESAANGTVFKLSVQPVINSAATATAVFAQPFSFQVVAANSPTSFAATGLPAGLSIDAASGLISGTPTQAGTTTVTLSAANSFGTGATTTLSLSVAPSISSGHLAFFAGEAALADGVYYLAFPSGDYFGYYSYLTNPLYIFHFDLGYEFCFDAADGNSGIYFYDFTSSHFFYTSPGFPFPYLYDFTLDSTLYYYPDPNNAGRYDSNGIRYFYDFSTSQIIIL